MRNHSLILIVFLTILLNGCDIFLPAEGTEGQACTNGGRCLDGLDCVSGKCVNPDNVDGDQADGDAPDGDAPDGDAPDGDDPVDGDSNTPDGDNDGNSCESAVIAESKCKYFTQAECMLHDWPSNCEVRDCVNYGWNHTCNTDGKCVKNCELDLGDVDPESKIADYVGVWGAVFSTAVRNTGLPLVTYQDIVSIHHTLARISEEDGRMRIQHKLCSLSQYNFKDDRILYEDLTQLVTPELYTRNCGLIEQYVDEPPAMEAGATFDTTRHIEVRGANLNDYTCDEQTMECNEAIPTTDDYLADDDRIWDQDYDGNPGMTTLITGVLDGELYWDQRWSTLWHGEVVDENRMWGMHHHTNEQHILDSDNPSLLYNLESVAHEDADRSYWRYQRLPDDATCEDVLKYVEDGNGEWLSFTITMDPEDAPSEDK